MKCSIRTFLYLPVKVCNDNLNDTADCDKAFDKSETDFSYLYSCPTQ